MIAFTEATDFSTYRQRNLELWSGTDEPQKLDRQGIVKANLKSKLAGLAVTTLPAMMPQASWATTIADYSVLGRAIGQVSYAASLPSTLLPAPLPFLDSHYEMLSYRSLENDWDYVGSEAISAGVIDAALSFLALLPSDVSAPEASASGDGTVDWFWRNGSFGATVTFYPNGRVAYFSMTESGHVKDSFKFSGSIPSELLESLRKL